jgi:hypothetical protein
MKLQMIILSLLISTSLFAEQGKAKGEKFEKVKATVLEHMDKHISALQTARSCAASADNKKAMKACRAPLKGIRKEFSKIRKKRREDRKNKKESN